MGVHPTVADWIHEQKVSDIALRPSRMGEQRTTTEEIPGGKKNVRISTEGGRILLQLQIKI